MDATAAALPVLVQDKGKNKTPRGPPLAWRLGVSLAAVALTWATSLRVAISVAGAFVVVPPGSLVRDTCRTLRDATTHAEAVYVDASTRKVHNATATTTTCSWMLKRCSKINR